MPPIAAWPVIWGDRQGRRNTGMLLIGIAMMALAVAATIAGFSTGAAELLWPGAVLALVGLTALVVAAHRPFSRGRAELVDTATLVRGRGVIPDLRVLFVSERPAGVALLVLSTIWAVALSVTTVVAVGIGLTGRLQAFLGAVVVGVFALLFWFVAVRGVIIRYRFDAIGRRPVGLSIGRDGVTLVRVADTVHLPWAAIRGVEADVTEPRRGMERRPLIRLRWTRNG